MALNKEDLDNLERLNRVREKLLEKYLEKDYKMRLKNVISDVVSDGKPMSEIVETTIVGYVDGKAILGSIIKRTSC